MNRKLALLIVTVAVVLAAVVLVRRLSSHPGVVLTLQMAVSPDDQTDFVAAQASSARFKYEMGKSAGVKSAQAQSLTVQRDPKRAVIHAHVGVPTLDAARRYADAFAQILQGQCGPKVEITLIQRSVP